VRRAGCRCANADMRFGTIRDRDDGSAKLDGRANRDHFDRPQDKRRRMGECDE
jgi:hypothetical protein